MGLQQPAPGRRRAPGAPHHLMQQLECALRRARIAPGEPEIGVDHAHQRERGKMMPLGHELRADHEIDLALGHRIELGAQPLDPAGKIARQHQRARLRKQRMHLFFQPLHARPAGDEGVGRAAFRAGLGLAAERSRNGGR